MRPRPSLLAAVAAAVVVAVALAAWSVTREAAPEVVARERARAFLDGYATADGRVARWDEGGDTVSEGQAYGLLLALVAGDEFRFDRIWAWTRQELERDDALLAWLWDDGAVVDEMPATDADIEAAWALLRAAERFERPEWRDDGLRLAGAVLDAATVRVDGRLVLTAGPWATGAPVVVNPSYLVPLVLDDLSLATGDPRWDELAASSRQLLAGVTRDGRRLPPDWARVGPGPALEPVGSPEGEGEPRYGLDAVRVPVRLATSCASGDGALAAALWPLLADLEDGGARIAYTLDGGATTGDGNPAGLVGAAAAASAAGDGDRAADLLEEAERLAGRHPSYYGEAWAALGRALLTTELLGGCAARR